MYESCHPLFPSHSLFLVKQWQLGMTNGALFGVPIPPQYDGTSQKIEQAVNQAIAEAEEIGISKRGKDVTPWLLKRVEELTSGVSLANSEHVAYICLCIKSLDCIRYCPRTKYSISG